MNPRAQALESAGNRQTRYGSSDVEGRFSAHVWTRALMQEMLPPHIYENVLEAMEGHGKIKSEYADPIALAMKEWALSHGATHYTHWFQPLTGSTAEKHEAFIDWSGPGEVIEKFSGGQLVQGEPDASSFPSGGLRTTYEARGYTGWDPTSPVFVWVAGDGVTLCIPSVFLSWAGDVLDNKIPLHRSERKINDAVMRLLSLTGIEARSVSSTIGLEQEYFVIDRALRNLRPDLVVVGRTLYGAPPAKGQELQDHYFGAVKDRILAYMRDFEGSALRLGIPVKTRHNEVAPSQHEVAPNFEKASIAIDHNILLMELMRQIAIKHELACLLHEKPFEGLNGSGKHCNWSLATNTGINLLDPTDTPQNNLHFLVLLTAILHATHRHAVLLRAAIGSAGNDHRLGGHEAPPAIMSAYLGEDLEELLDNIEAEREHLKKNGKGLVDLGVIALPHLKKDTTDRNRTSPFAFTGNKFEMRALGSAASPAFFVTAMNVIVAETLNAMLDEMEEKGGSFLDAAMEVIRKYLRASRAIRFSGDNYSEEWVKEAEKRELPNIANSLDAYPVLLKPETIQAFNGILTAQELASRYEILTETYTHQIQIEASLMVEMFSTQVLPSAMIYQKQLAKSVEKAEGVLQKSLSGQRELLQTFSQLVEEGIALTQKLKGFDGTCQEKITACNALRQVVDTIETLGNDATWPHPKYRELLFMN